jgi:hypothetical protein
VARLYSATFRRPRIEHGTAFDLWVANNPATFSRFPAQSIDRSRDVAAAQLPAEDRNLLRSLAGDQYAIAHWYFQRAIGFMREHPWQVALGGARKLAAAFSWRLSPYREPFEQFVYAAGYVPVALLGLIGMLQARRKPETALIALLFLGFIAVTTVFWAHTSHRSYLNVYWIIFAASLFTPARGDDIA